MALAGIKRSALSAAAMLLVISATALFGVRWVPFLAVAENWVFDLRIVLMSPAEPQNQEIVVLTITEETLATLPVRSPLDRGFLANLVETLGNAGVRAIGIDILFDQPTDEARDDALLQAMRESPVPLIVAWADTTDGLTDDQSEHLDTYLEGIKKGLASFVRDDRDGVIRWTSPGRNKGSGAVRGFASAISETLGGNVTDRPLRLAFQGPPDSSTPPFRTYPAHTASILPVDWFAGKVVLIGADQPNEDRFRTPLSAVVGASDQTTPGVIIHANALAQILNGRVLPETGLPIDLAIVILVSSLGWFVARLDASVLIQISVGMMSIAALWVGGFFVFSFGEVLIPLIAPTTGLTLAFGTSSAVSGRYHQKQKKFIRQAFSRYVSPAVVARLVSDPDRLKLGGEKREMTLLFTDIAGFTTLSEGLEPEVLVNLLNDYLDGMSRIVLSHDGTVDKFIGDAVVAFFGAPEHQPDHANQAVACALEMDEFAEGFAAEQNKRGIGFGITRIGVHTGIAIVGNFGGQAHFDYTAMGDTVNIAARLEGANKVLGTRICVSGSTEELCSDQAFRPVGDLVLKGKVQSVSTFEPLGLERAGSAQTARYLALYERLLAVDPSVREALEDFVQRWPEDGIARLHLHRLEQGFSGVRIVMEEK